MTFEERVAKVKPSKSDINALILDYLTAEGYPRAAANFSREAKLAPQADDASMRARRDVAQFIRRGKIQEAIEAINEHDAELLDIDASLHFSLLRLQFVELWRNHPSDDDLPVLLAFSNQQLGPRAITNADFRKKLEQTMALLMYPRDNLLPAQSDLLLPSHREQVAEQANQALLFRKTAKREAAIRQLVKMRVWAEDQARKEKNNDLPARLDIGLVEDASTGRTDAMVTT